MLIRLLLENRQNIVRKHHAVEKYNIFNARRDGLQASHICVPGGQRQPLARHILQTVDKLSEFAVQAEDVFVLRYIRRYVEKGVNDSDRIRHMIKHTMDLNTVTEQMKKILFSVPEDYRSLLSG